MKKNRSDSASEESSYTSSKSKKDTKDVSPVKKDTKDSSKKDIKDVSPVKKDTKDSSKKDVKDTKDSSKKDVKDTKDSSKKDVKDTKDSSKKDVKNEPKNKQQKEVSSEDDDYFEPKVNWNKILKDLVKANFIIVKTYNLPFETLYCLVSPLGHYMYLLVTSTKESDYELALDFNIDFEGDALIENDMIHIKRGNKIVSYKSLSKTKENKIVMYLIDHTIDVNDIIINNDVRVCKIKNDIHKNAILTSSCLGSIREILVNSEDYKRTGRECKEAHDKMTQLREETILKFKSNDYDDSLIRRLTESYVVFDDKVLQFNTVLNKMIEDIGKLIIDNV